MDTNKLITQAVEKGIKPSGRPVKRYQYNFEGSGSDFKRRPDNSIAPEILRRFAVTHEISRICINARKRQIAQLDWDISPMRGQKGKSVSNDRIDLVKRFFKHIGGYRTRFRSVQDIMIEDLLVLDSISAYKERDAKGRLLWLKTIDPASIKLVVDEWGNTPEPPDIAYRQYIRGELQAEFTADQLVWDSMNPRSTTPYGLAPLESLILVVSSALRSELFNLDYLTYQNIPEGLLEMPEGWSRQMIDEFQDSWDAFTSGSGETNSKLRVVPAGTRYEATKKPDEMGFEAFNHWLMQITTAMFDIQPHEIGFTDKTNRATAKQQDDVTQRRGIEPLAQMLKEIWDDIIQVDLGYEDLEFTYLGLEDEDTLLDAQSDAAQLASGAVSIDEVRIRRGLEPIGITTPYIIGQGLTWVASGIVQNELDDASSHFELPVDAGDDEAENDSDSSDDANASNFDSDAAGTSVDQNENTTVSTADTLTDLRKALLDEPLVALEKELKAFKTFAASRLKKGKYRDFSSKVLPLPILAELNVRAEKATTVAEIDRIVHIGQHLIKADTKHGGHNNVLNTLFGLAAFKAIKDAFQKGIAHQMNHTATKLRPLDAAPLSAPKFVDNHMPKLSSVVDKGQVADWNTTVFNTSVNSLYKAVGADTEFNLTSNAYTEKMASAADDLLQQSSLDDTTKKTIVGIIQQGVEDNKTPDEIASDIEDQVDGLSDYRASMIAVTETNDMANTAQLDAMKQMGVDMKTWVTYGDDPCPICIGNATEGPIPIDQTFDSGDDAPEAHPWCQCALDESVDISDDSLDNLWDGS